MSREVPWTIERVVVLGGRVDSQRVVKGRNQVVRMDRRALRNHPCVVGEAVKRRGCGIEFGGSGHYSALEGTDAHRVGTEAEQSRHRCLLIARPRELAARRLYGPICFECSRGAVARFSLRSGAFSATMLQHCSRFEGEIHHLGHVQSRGQPRPHARHFRGPPRARLQREDSLRRVISTRSLGTKERSRSPRERYEL